ncbi:MAG TPA: division/cell wall cluster transcriptional repressor MraZ [Oligoflexia bacterium]|nr:division/cell wall cluster transcriptional repressor MraZ [Oligoflexia bacterium]HMP27761.1 division/cell wall cluster transcriptional repressor MraZ [Oligoflexia bacterium]
MSTKKIDRRDLSQEKDRDSLLLKDRECATTADKNLYIFRGNFIHTIDDKGRLSLPADFREQLRARGERSVVLTNYISDGARCLEGFGITAWSEFEKKLRVKSRFSSKLQQLENYYLSRSAECAFDDGGRILVPQHLRQYANLEREVTFTSSIHGFRIWDKRVWESIFDAAESALMENPDLFADVDI